MAIIRNILSLFFSRPKYYWSIRYVLKSGEIVREERIATDPDEALATFQKRQNIKKFLSVKPAFHQYT